MAGKRKGFFGGADAVVFYVFEETSGSVSVKRCKMRETVDLFPVVCSGDQNGPVASDADRIGMRRVDRYVSGASIVACHFPSDVTPPTPQVSAWMTFMF